MIVEFIIYKSYFRNPKQESYFNILKGQVPQYNQSIVSYFLFINIHSIKILLLWKPSFITSSPIDQILVEI